MLADYPIHATLPATDMERAKRFLHRKAWPNGGK